MSHLARLVADAFATCETLSASDGTDPHAELAEARLGHGIVAREWAATVLHAHETGQPRPSLDEHPKSAVVVAAQALLTGTGLLSAALFTGTPGYDVDALVHIAERTANPELLDELAGHRRARVRRATVRNPATTTATKLRLVDDPETFVRRDLARTSTDLALQTAIAGDPNVEVRTILAKNPHLHPEVAHRFARDRSTRLRILYAQSDLADPAELARLSRSRNIDIVLAVARNQRTPVDVLEALVARSSSPVVRAAGGTLDRLQSAA